MYARYGEEEEKIICSFEQIYQVFQINYTNDNLY